MDDMRNTEYDFDDFDPLWTFEQAQAAGTDGPLSPFGRWSAWLILSSCERNYREGDGEAFLTGLRLCAKHRFPMPTWLADAVTNSVSKWERFEVKTLDQAIGISRKKGTHMNARKKHKFLEKVVPPLVKHYHGPKDTPIDENIFNIVGKELGISGGTVKEAYYNSFIYKELYKKD